MTAVNRTVFGIKGHHHHALPPDWEGPVCRVWV